MQMTGGNRAIRDRVVNGKTLHLFKKVKDGYVPLIGAMHADVTPVP
jgi:hypothetical protein